MTKLPKYLRDLEPPVKEEGVTFSQNPSHPFWRVRVAFSKGQPPCLERIRAGSAQQALDFACARYPFVDRGASTVIGLWDGAPSPVASEANDSEEKPAQGPPSPKLAPVARDSRGRATPTDADVMAASDAHAAGMTWDLIAAQFICNERHLRSRVKAYQREHGIPRTRVGSHKQGSHDSGLAFGSKASLVIDANGAKFAVEVTVSPL